MSDTSSVQIKHIKKKNSITKILEKTIQINSIVLNLILIYTKKYSNKKTLIRLYSTAINLYFETQIASKVIFN
mgnify:CR=1 FL=1